VKKPKTHPHLEDAPLSLRCYSCPCDIKTASIWVEAEKPVLFKSVAPYVRDEAEPVVRPATDANDGRVVAGFPITGECLIQPGGKEHKEEGADEPNGCGRCR
jgi:hypothetical protein